MDNEGEDDHYEDSGEDMDNEGEDDHYEDTVFIVVVLTLVVHILTVFKTVVKIWMRTMTMKTYADCGDNK